LGWVKRGDGEAIGELGTAAACFGSSVTPPLSEPLQGEHEKGGENVSLPQVVFERNYFVLTGCVCGLSFT